MDGLTVRVRPKRDGCGGAFTTPACLGWTFTYHLQVHSRRCCSMQQAHTHLVTHKKCISRLHAADLQHASALVGVIDKHSSTNKHNPNPTVSRPTCDREGAATRRMPQARHGWAVPVVVVYVHSSTVRTCCPTLPTKALRTTFLHTQCQLHSHNIIHNRKKGLTPRTPNLHPLQNTYLHASTCCCCCWTCSTTTNPRHCAWSCSCLCTTYTYMCN